MNDVAIKLIDRFGELTKPDQVCNNGATGLIWACSNNMDDVAIKLIDTFGEISKPDYVDNYGNTALIFAKKYCNRTVVRKISNLLGKRYLLFW